MSSSVDRPRWQSLHRPSLVTEALVAILIGDGDDAEGFADRWATMVPRCAFAALRVAPADPGFDPGAAIAAEAAALGLGTGQVILIGRHASAPIALDLVLSGRIAGINAILLDLPAGPVPADPPDVQASLRFIQHQQPGDEADRFEATVRALRRSSLDIRTITFSDGRDPHYRALGTFLVELVAKAGRYRSGAAR